MARPPGLVPVSQPTAPLPATSPGFLAAPRQVNSRCGMDKRSQHSDRQTAPPCSAPGSPPLPGASPAHTAARRRPQSPRPATRRGHVTAGTDTAAVCGLHNTRLALALSSPFPRPGARTPRTWLWSLDQPLGWGTTRQKGLGPRLTVWTPGQVMETDPDIRLT